MFLKKNHRKQRTMQEQSQFQDKAKTNQHKDMEVEEQLPVPPVRKVDQTESNPTVSDDDDGAQALKSLLLKDETEGADKSETPKEKTSTEGKIQGAENQKNDQGSEEGSETVLLDNDSEKKVKASNSDLIEVAKSTATKVIIDAQRKVSETTSNKTTKESETNGTSAEGMNAESGKTKEEVHLDWKDDKDGAQGLKTLLKDGKEEEEKSENNIEVISVATATVTKVIAEAKKKVADTASGKSTTSSEEKKEATPEKDKTSPKENQPDWRRDDKDGAKELKSLLQGDLEQDSEKEGAGDKTVTASEAKPTKDQVGEKGKDKTAGKEQEATTDKEVDKKPSTSSAGDSNLEEQSRGENSSEEATLNWRDENGGAKGLKAELQKSTEEDPSANEALISAAKETVTKVINDAKQKVSNDEKGESTESKKKEVEKKKSTTDEHKAEQSLNWQDGKEDDAK